MSPAQLFLPFTSLVIYGIAFFAYWKRLYTDIPSDRRHPVFDLEMNGSLNLLGFSVAIFGVLVGVNKSPDRIEIPTYHISLSIAFFVASYGLYLLRMREAFIYFASACRNAGVWTLISAMTSLVWNSYRPAADVLVGLEALYTIYLSSMLRSSPNTKQ